MAKNNMKTEWKGLWFNRSGVYSGQVLNKSDIPPYARLVVRFNKFYEADSNKPKFVYCFASGNAHKAITVKSEECEEGYTFSEDELQDLINRIACAVGGDGEYGEWLVDDFV